MAGSAKLSCRFRTILSTKSHFCRQFFTSVNNPPLSESTQILAVRPTLSIPTNAYCTNNSTTPSDIVRVSVEDGLPVITIPLPSTNQVCHFPLRPFGQTIGQFLQTLKDEDPTITTATVYSSGDIRLANSVTIDDLLRLKFKLQLNDKTYNVDPPTLDIYHAHNPSEELNHVQGMICKLYSSLNVKEHQIAQEAEISKQLSQMKTDIEPYEKFANALMLKSEKHTNRLAWLGLGLMGLQMGFLARLTWWEYSWDIMEPVTYFITYSTSLVMFAYYVVTKQDYNFPLVKDRQFLITFYKHAKKQGLDLDKYNSLKESIAQAELDLKRLRDPLQANLPIQQIQKQPQLKS